mmetsp:Transcript_28931/g.29270  ORF Transcript_28931/g.29270 Transcript_28931/m.29270 type:complete len:778 (-) Transcript_28931:197-2530(-)|eukprot:CAMPEP_0182419030 /NCGR_PEP_ID=MMETSP1167-20130531/3414_1 /TAXON_ID=2988 /ORGANISM="Mallomonas Sp, Strain CCMP3275" /LENGTH=777 /DNA_ID=CAMNT_0024593595 /DNA_START=110 /DNA_END=2443 /DNA_ORIENTATION=-
MIALCLFLLVTINALDNRLFGPERGEIIVNNPPQLDLHSFFHAPSVPTGYPTFIYADDQYQEEESSEFEQMSDDIKEIAESSSSEQMTNSQGSVPTGYPTFIYADYQYEDGLEEDQLNSGNTREQSTESISAPDTESDVEGRSESRLISSPDQVSKWYVLLLDSESPSVDPTTAPSLAPSADPTVTPTRSPIVVPSAAPSVLPSSSPSTDPTLLPTTSPSSIPTSSPSSYPSGYPSFSPTSDVPTPRPTEAPTIAFKDLGVCIDLLLEDTFGDGWDTASMFMYPSDGTAAQMMTLECGKISTISQFCFHPEINVDGDYVVIGVTGYNPTNPWEIHWEALNPSDNKVYIGNFETSLTFKFHYDGASKTSISLIASVGALPAKDVCETCVQYAALSAPHPPPMGKAGPEGKKVGKAALSSIPVSAVGDDLGTLAFGGYHDTWFSADYYGSRFTISDQDSINLFYSGALCDGKLGCNIVLDDGTYKWRVTGALNTYSGGVYWKFCGVEGTAMNELTFTVKDQYCRAVARMDLSTMCAAIQSGLLESEVTLAGKIHLTGVDADSINNAPSFEILRKSLAEEFINSRPEVTAEHVSVEIKSVEKAAVGERQLKEATSMDNISEVKFSVRMKADAFGEDGTSEDGRANVVLNSKSYLEKSMASGLFTTRIKSAARVTKIEQLKSITKAELLELFVMHLPTAFATKISLAVNSVVIVGGVSGLAFAVLMVSFITKRRSRSSLPYSTLTNPTDDTIHADNSRLESSGMSFNLVDSDRDSEEAILL